MGKNHPNYEACLAHERSGVREWPFGYKFLPDTEDPTYLHHNGYVLLVRVFKKIRISKIHKKKRKRSQQIYTSPLDPLLYRTFLSKDQIGRPVQFQP